MTSSIKLVNRSEEFFHQIITETLKAKQFQLSVEAEFYLVNLLSDFTRTEKMWSLNEFGEYEDRPLIFLIKEAEESPRVEVKKSVYRQVGDLALCKVGIFPNKKISSPYYGVMGKMGYSGAAKFSDEENLRSLYREMSDNFERIVFLLRRVPELNISRNYR
jgi:hypothetical protein